MADYIVHGAITTSLLHDIPVGTLKAWAYRYKVRYDPKVDTGDATVETGDATLAPASSTLAPARLRETIEEVRTRMERVREFHKVKQEQIRGALRTALLERAFDALDLWDAEHVDFKGKDNEEVTYPSATDAGRLALAQAAAILLKEYRLEVGEATSRPLSTAEVNDVARTDHERALLRTILDDAIGFAESGEEVLAEGPEPPQD
jgi:hypothetical protein